MNGKGEEMEKKKTKNLRNYSILEYIKFIIPSLLGIILFIMPISENGEITIPIAVLSNKLQGFFAEYMQNILLVLVCFSFVGAILFKMIKLCTKDCKMIQHKLVKSLFDVSILWLVFRGIAAAFTILICTGSTFEMVVSTNTGGLVFYDLLPILFTIFLLAGLFLPLLLNFGLLEFAGTLLIKVMKPVFGLPGRSAVDAIASWLGDGTIGVLLTSKQYEDGFYTEKEACIIGTSFSLVSITFSLVVINTVGLGNMFVPFYLTVTFACIIAAILLPKIPPLSRKKNLLITGKAPENVDEIPKDQTGFSYGVECALKKVKDVKVIRSIFVEGVHNVLDMWISVIPIVMTIGTIALIIAEYTPIFSYLGMPFVPLLELLGIPEAAAASQTLFAGFADMLLPSVMVADTVSSELTRFVVAAVSVSQLIYLSEVGALILASKIPVKLGELFIIFIERTLLTLPIIAIIAHMIF